jgi:ABC-type lipoprotein release transport system permease subunit
MVEELVKKKLGAPQVHRKGAFDPRNSQPLKLDFAAGGQLEQRLLATPGVTGAAPRISFAAMVGNGTTSTLVFASAGDPVREALVVPLGQHDVVGNSLSSASPHGTVLGTSLAQALKVSPGSSLTLQASTRDGRENAVDLDLIGPLDGANPLESKRLAVLSLGYAQELLGMPGSTTGFVVVPTIPTALVVLALGLSSAGAIGAAFYPALRAARLRPVEALRDA